MQESTQNDNVVNKNNSNSTTGNTQKGSEYEKSTLNPDDLDQRWLRWKCLKCGFVYEGQKPKNVCPKCGNDDPDLFDDAS